MVSTTGSAAKEVCHERLVEGRQVARAFSCPPVSLTFVAGRRDFRPSPRGEPPAMMLGAFTPSEEE
jgi:hypothetical protein